jgi:Protein of unknown function (DUF4199)
MQKIVLKYGVISGILIALMMSATVPFQDKIDSGHGFIGYITGYTTMVLSFLLVYFGIRSYRDQVGGGQISFGKGFAVGICITLITCIFYVVTWEIIYFNFMHDFMDKYAAHVIEKARAAGASAAALQAKTQQMDQMKRLYENPLYNAAMTFIEPFPVGLLITLLSAAVLRRKSGTPALRAAEQI